MVLAGHSMGAHTIAALALERPERIAGVVLIGPATVGVPLTTEALAGWDALADALDRGGMEEFVRVNDSTRLDDHWREVVARITRERLGRHRHLDAVAEALRQVPRSLPFEGLDELSHLDVPALVVASHDETDPGHPRAVAEEWGERLPDARLVSEEPGSVTARVAGREALAGDRGVLRGGARDLGRRTLDFVRATFSAASDLAAVAEPPRCDRARTWGSRSRTPASARFGLRNAVFALGDTFLEVVSPSRRDRRGPLDRAQRRRLRLHADVPGR